MNIGFACMGKMGTPMALNLVKAGHKVKVYNRTHSATEPLVAAGAVAVKDPKELADVDLLFTMPASDAVLDTVLITSGLLAELGRHATSKGKGSFFSRPVHVCCGTLSISYVTRLCEQHITHGVEYASMPVLGRPDAAAAAVLQLLYGGSEALRAVLEPIVVPAMGSKLRNYGAKALNANLMKITFNMVLACSIEAISESCALTQKYDIPSHEITDLLSTTLFDCIAYRGYGEMISKHKFRPAGATLTGVGLKDCKLALEAGELAGVPLPFASIVRDNTLDGIANGMGEWDWASVALVAERRAGIKREREE